MTSRETLGLALVAIAGYLVWKELTPAPAGSPSSGATTGSPSGGNGSSTSAGTTLLQTIPSTTGPTFANAPIASVGPKQPTITPAPIVSNVVSHPPATTPAPMLPPAVLPVMADQPIVTLAPAPAAPVFAPIVVAPPAPMPIAPPTSIDFGLPGGGSIPDDAVITNAANAPIDYYTPQF